MATAETLDIVARDLELINALSSAAENLAIRSTVEGISAAERAALRNKAKTANEQAGALLTREPSRSLATRRMMRSRRSMMP